MELLKLLSTNEIVAQILSFLLLFILLRIFVWRRLLGLLDQRKARIASELKKIQDSQGEVARLKSEYEIQLSQIEDKARQIMQEAVEEGKKATQEIIKKAHEDSEDILENARKSVKYELAKAKEELKEKIIDLTISATENIIKDRFTGEDDRRLVNDFLEKVDRIE